MKPPGLAVRPASTRGLSFALELSTCAERGRNEP